MPGSLTHSPADVLRRVLIALGTGTNPASNSTWPIYAGGEPDRPDSVITVYDTQGRTGMREHVEAERDEHHGIQVRIRGAAHASGYTKARAVAVALDGIYQHNVTLGAVTYLVHCVTRTSDVIALGKEAPASKRSLFTINALMMVRMLPL